MIQFTIQQNVLQVKPNEPNCLKLKFFDEEWQQNFVFLLCKVTQVTFEKLEL